ncbi:MAG: arylsulfatase [Verrucomicrobiota bacterium]
MRSFFCHHGLLFFLGAALFSAPLQATDRPNMVVILVDDMGFSDIGCYGGEIATPNIDRLAQEGIRFKQFYNTGRCCPTRASLLTGLHPHQAGIGHMTETPVAPSPLSDDPYQGYLNDRCVTLAQVLKKAGYHTLMTGKWHLGLHRRECWPLQRGFDRYFGILSGASDYFNPDGERGLTLMNEPVKAGKDFYVTDAFTEQACDFIDAAHAEDKDKPFFLYLAYTAPHWPLEAKPEDLAKYEGAYGEGWKAVSKKRLERQKAMGLIDPDWTPAPHEGPDWDSLTDEERKLSDLRMAAYAGCVDSIDQNIGRLIERLKTNGQFENTILFFMTDNGACQEFNILGKGTEEEIRDHSKTRGTAGPTCGRAWANVSNTPFRLYKHFLHEGGMATPLVVHWPAGIPKEKHGGFIENFGYLPDFMPTCLELAGADYPAESDGHPVTPHAGTSLVPLIVGKDEAVHRSPVFWEHEGNRAMRDGKWKLVWAKEGPWELFDLEKDRTEMDDLTQAMPQRAERMIRTWNSWARRTGVQFQTSFSYYKMINRFRTQEKAQP